MIGVSLPSTHFHDATSHRAVRLRWFLKELGHIFGPHPPRFRMYAQELSTPDHILQGDLGAILSIYLKLPSQQADQIFQTADPVRQLPHAQYLLFCQQTGASGQQADNALGSVAGGA